MRKLLLALSLCICAEAAFGEEVLREISWTHLKQEGRLLNGAIIAADKQTPFEQLQIVSAARVPTTVEILSIEKPGITSTRYGITGKVRYENVEGKGYLEMWSYFPDGGFYFSRTLAETGPLRYLEGSSEWRPFTLPFFADGISLRPDKLVVNVVFPAGGTVVLGQLRLVQYAEARQEGAIAGEWWDRRAGGAMAGLLGVLVGLCGGMIAGRARLRKGRRSVMAQLKVMLGIGAALVLAGAAAYGASQPFHVWCPLLLPGLLACAAFVPLLIYVRKRYEELELRRMEAMDAPPRFE